MEQADGERESDDGNAAEMSRKAGSDGQWSSPWG
jgi:hypothetical protein